MSILKIMLQDKITQSAVINGKTIKRQQTGTEERKKD